MIFVTVGTQLPFDRLIKAIDDFALLNNQAGRIYAQIGPSEYTPSNVEFEDFVTPERAKELIVESDLIIAHAGMGSILTALQYNKPIVVMPRSCKYGEHRNDHQLSTAKWIESIPGIFVAWDEIQLLEVLQNQDMLISGKPIGPDADEQLLSYVSNFINDTK